jgi:hypothetical protein
MIVIKYNLACFLVSIGRPCEVCCSPTRLHLSCILYCRKQARAQGSLMEIELGDSVPDDSFAQ